MLRGRRSTFKLKFNKIVEALDFLMGSPWPPC
jgi:hypothetical protein